MRNTLYIIGLLVVTYTSMAQSLNQDANGFSTVVLPSSNLSLDIADGTANFNVSTYLRKNGESLEVTDNGFLVGGSISAKVENGLGALVSASNVAPSATLGGLIGYKIYSNNDASIQRRTQEYSQRRKILSSEIKENRDKSFITLEALKAAKRVDSALFAESTTYLTQNDKGKRKKQESTFIKLRDGLLDGSITDRPNVDPSAIDLILDFYDDEINKKFDEALKLSNKINEITAEGSRYAFHQVFVRGGISGSEFKYDYGQDSTTIDSRFQKRNFNGWNIEAAYNLQYMDDHFFGISYQIQGDHNLSTLDDFEFTLTKIDSTITEGQFSNATKVKAFSGEYDTFTRHSVNFDYVWVTPINDKDDDPSNVFLALNPYIRHQMYDARKTIKENTIVGIGLNAFSSQKQKLLGGVSIQLNDVFGVNAKEDTTFGDRVSIGLIAKFSFSGLVPAKDSK